MMLPALLVWGCATVQQGKFSSDFRIRGNDDIVNLVNTMNSISQVGVLAQDLNSGDILVDFRSGHLFTPASNVKLFTAAAALKILGPEFQFSTGVWVDDTSENGHSQWLALKGSGDPFLSLKDLEAISTFISRQFTRLDTLIIDASVFDGLYYGPGWMWDEGSNRDAAQISGLNLNWNTIDLVVIEDTLEYGTVILSSPNTAYVSIDNQVMIVADTSAEKKLTAERFWWNNSNHVAVTGAVIPGNLPDSLHSNINDPAAFAGTVFKELLLADGVTLDTVIFSGVPVNGKKILVHPSERLPVMLQYFLKETDNLVGEALLKTLNHSQNGEPGSWSGGLKLIRTFLSGEVEIDTAGMRLADGSGLSRYNLLSPQITVKLLKYIYEDSLGSEIIIPSLPVAGIDGTLQDRLTRPVTKGNVRAKTGSLGNVSTLSGYLKTLKGREIVFSIMMNGFTVDRKTIRDLQDRLCELLVAME